MRRPFRWLLARYLRLLSRLTLWRFRPFVIAVAGSTRKTLTKEQLYAALADRYAVRRNPRSYNTEIGVPLSILGISSGDSSYRRWAVAMLEGFIKLFRFRYPDLLILELGTERPGDMGELLRIVRPRVALFTNVEAGAGEGSVDDIRVVEDEQRRLIAKLPKDGLAIINGHDPLLVDIAPSASCRVVRYHADSREASVKAAVELTVAEVQKLRPARPKRGR